MIRILALLCLAPAFSLVPKLFDPCNKNDTKCLNEATENFLEKSCNGIPQYDIKPLDPLIIPDLKFVVDPAMGLAFDFTNINVTGLKSQQIFDFQMDTEKKSVVLKTQVVLNIAGDLKIIFTKKNKELTGTYTASTTALGSSQYGYNLIKKGDDEYFEVGPETITCQIIGEPVVTVGEALQNTLDNVALGSSQYGYNLTKMGDDKYFEVGPETKTGEIIGEPLVTVQKTLLNASDKDSNAKAMKPDYESNKASLRKKTLCKIIETAYVTVIHNIRALGKILPKSAFFTDI